MRARGERQSGIASTLDSLLALSLVLVVWQVVSMWLPDAVAGPRASLMRLGAILTGSRYVGDLAETGIAFLWGLGISWAGGLVLAVWFGVRRYAGAVAEPVLVSFYSIPKVTLYPVILLIFGLGMQAKVSFGVLHGIVPVTLIGMSAIRNLKPIYLRSARSLDLSRYQTIRRVLLPAVLPELMTGLKIGFAMTLLGTLIGEMFGAQRGLGFLMMRAIGLNDSATIMAVVVLLLVVALVGNFILSGCIRLAGGTVD